MSYLEEATAFRRLEKRVRPLLPWLSLCLINIDALIGLITLHLADPQNPGLETVWSLRKCGPQAPGPSS